MKTHKNRAVWALLFGVFTLLLGLERSEYSFGGVSEWPLITYRCDYDCLGITPVPFGQTLCSNTTWNEAEQTCLKVISDEGTQYPVACASSRTDAICNYCECSPPLKPFYTGKACSCHSK